MCDCHSYNWEVGVVPEVQLEYPLDRRDRTICVDECIARVIKHLWNHEVETLGCCCGHNEKAPSIVLAQNVTKESANVVRELVKEVDDRKFTLHSSSFIEV